MAGKLFFGKLTHSRGVRQSVTTKSQRSAADAKGADGANIKDSEESQQYLGSSIYIGER
jgi:hypothetical protein